MCIFRACPVDIDLTILDLELMQARVIFVPDGWSFSKVGDVFEVRNNLRKPISEKERDKNPGPYPYYGPTRIQGHISSFCQDGEYALIGEDGDHFLKYRSLKMTQMISGKCTVNNHAHIIEGTRRACREWFYYYFMHRDIFSFLTRQGAGRFKLNKSALEKIPLLVPPLPEQRKIGRILLTWDEAIYATDQVLANSVQRRKALVQQMLTGKKRLPRLGAASSGGYGRSNLPEGWSYERIGEIAHEVAARNKAQADLPVISCSKYHGFVDSLKYFKKKVYSDDTSNYKVIRRGEFGFPANHVEEGSIGLQDLHEEGIVSPIYVVFRADGRKVDNFYLYTLLKTDHYRQVFASATSASVDRRGSLRWQYFSRIKVRLPSLEEQKAISEIIRSAEQEIEMTEAKLEKLRTEKKALMQHLLTGKRRVKVDETKAEEAPA